MNWLTGGISCPFFCADVGDIEYRAGAVLLYTIKLKDGRIKATQQDTDLTFNDYLHCGKCLRDFWLSDVGISLSDIDWEELA